MANVDGTFYSGESQRPNTTPVSPPNAGDDPVYPINPPGTTNTTLYKLLGDVTDSSFVGKNGFVPVVVGENVLTLQSLTTNVLATPLTGYVVGANTSLAATDTILGAFQKVQGQINARVSGTIATGQVAFGTGVNTVGGEPDFTFDTSIKRIIVSRSGNSAGIAFIRKNIPLGIEFLGVNVFQSYTTGTTATNGAVISARSSGAWSSTSAPTDLHFSTTPLGSTSFLDRVIITSQGLVGINTISPNNTLDVNGTARIRTISNGTGDFLTKSATGVITSRTAAEVRTDISAIGGSGAVNRIPKFTPNTTTLGPSTIREVNGYVGIGLDPIDAMGLRFGTTITGNVNGYGLLFSNSISSDVTTSFRGVQTTISTQASAFNITNVYHFLASLSLGAGSSITNQYGYAVASTIGTTSTNSYAFWSGVNAGTNKWNLYMSGNADNYLAGNLWIGTTSGTDKLDVNGTARIRTISNGVGNFLTKDVNGVITSRTASEVLSDIGAVQSVIAGTGIQISGTAVNPSVFLTGQALSFHALTGDGFVYRTSGIVGVRTLTAGAGISITNGDGIAGNPVISADSSLSKFSYTSSFTISTTYQNMPATFGANSFLSADILENQVFQLDLTISDQRGSGGGTGSILFVKIFGREYQVVFPTPFEIPEIHNLSFIIQGGSGASSARLISTKIIKMSGSVYITPVQYYSLSTAIGYTDTVDLSVSKTIEIKTIIDNSGPILQYAKIYRII